MNSSSPLPFLVFSLFIMLGFSVSLATADLYKICRYKEFKCGNISAGYPFSGGDRAYECGHPHLQLYCDNRTNTTTIEIGEVKYKVLDIDQDHQILRIAREDLINDGFCNPSQFQNHHPILDFYLFDHVPGNTDITLFYDCQRSIPPILGPFFCNNNSTTVYITIGDDIPPEGCSDNVTFPILTTPLEGLNNSALRLELEKALEKGFELKWKEDIEEACRKCNDSGRACGFDPWIHQPTCYCPFGFEYWEEAKECRRKDTILSCSARSRCGNIQNIGYPFWGLDRPESCGYPGFKLDCNENIPEIRIMSATYKVLAINSPSRILRVARIDYTDNICPTYLINSTFDTSLFEYTRDTRDLRLYYGCQPLTAVEENLTSIQGISSQFDCTINATNIIGYYLTRDISETSFGNFVTIISRSIGYCSNSVIIPVSNSEVESLEQNRSSDALEEALRFGFDLHWSTNDSLCDACLNSRGQCGHDLSSGEFICYCSNGSYSDLCPRRSSGDNSKAVKLGLGIGIPGAAIFGILLGMGILCIRQQRRKKIAARVNGRDLRTPPTSKGPPTSTTNTSQSNSSYYISNYDVEGGSTYFGAHVFTYEELEQATDNFNPSKELGEGGFGTVYYGVLNDGRVVAVKRLYESNFKRVDQYMNEIEILTRIRHPNLVILYGCTSRRSRELLLVYEYIPNGTVADHLHGERSNFCSLTWHVRLNIAVETAKALAYLHAADIIHRDVKSSNILLDMNFHVKVADFGLSRLFPHDVTHISTAPRGTPGYVDPEYYQCYQLTEKSDVYSFGVVLIELVSAKQAVDINRHRHDINLANMAVSRIQNQALHELVDPTLGFESDFSVKTAITLVAELAFRCLQEEKDMRPSMMEVLETLKEIQDEQLGVQKAEVVDMRSEAEVADI